MKEGADFREIRLAMSDIAALLPRIGGDLGREFFGLVQVLGGRPLGEVEGLDGLLPASPRLRHEVRDICLDRVDARLQRLYREHFRDHPPPPDSTHRERLAMLAGTETEARRLVDGFDWAWLAGWLGLERIGEGAADCRRRLCGMRTRVRTLTIRFTYHCNFACAHCYNESSPHRKGERLSREAILDLVRQMPEAGLGTLNLSGGEPLLYLEDCAAAIRVARDQGTPRININTNGWWARDDRRALAVLERLSEVGFLASPRDTLKVSAGIHHQPFLPFERIVAMAGLFRDRFGRGLVVDYETGGEPLDGIAERLGEGVEFVTRRLLAAGRMDGAPARGDGGDSPCLTTPHVAIDPDGTVTPCCGYNYRNRGLRIGRFPDDPLPVLVQAVQNDPVFQFLTAKPMRDLIAHLDGFPFRRDGDSCELCQAMLSGIGDREPLLRRLFPGQRFYPFRFDLP